MAGRDNAVALAGKRAARRAAAAVIALVAVLSLLLAYLLLSTGTLTALVGMPGWQRVLLSLVFGAGFVALF
ncbi:MAG: hypothetical protein LBI99_02030, partial [Propionibacteriaceae bacterium]|nr:hypothetical protein [Propionibacteriaceae bacterium]